MTLLADTFNGGELRDNINALNYLRSSTYGLDTSKTAPQNAAALQNALDALSVKQTSSGQPYGSPLTIEPGAYAIGPFKLRDRVHLLGGKGGGQGYRNAPVRFLAQNVPDDGYLISQDVASIRDFGLSGIAIYGGGATSKFGAINLTDALDAIFTGIHVDNFGKEAFKGALSNARISDSFFLGLLNTGLLSAAAGAFTLSGADHQIKNCEFTGPSSSAVSSASLYAAAAMLSTYDSLIASNVFQIGDIGLRVVNSARNRFANNRFDSNAGHGLYLDSSVYELFAACRWSRNSRAGNGLYDHIYVPATTGGSNAVFDTPVFNNNGNSVGRWYNGLKNNNTTSGNRFWNPTGEVGTQNEPFAFTGYDFADIPANLPATLPTGSNPSVRGQKVFNTNNSVATTLNSFQNGAGTLEVVLHNGDGGLTTVGNTANIKTKTGADVVLNNLPMRFVRRGTTYWEV